MFIHNSSVVSEHGLSEVQRVQYIGQTQSDLIEYTIVPASDLIQLILVMIYYNFIVHITIMPIEIKGKVVGRLYSR